MKKTIILSTGKGYKVWRNGILRSLAFFLVFFSFLLAKAQDTKIPPSQLVVKDTINFGDSTKAGLINKILQPIRFRENKIKRERERIVELIRKLAKEGDVSIDSATVNAIATDLIALTEGLAAARDTSTRLQDEIEQLLLNLDTKAPKQLVDSVQVQLGNVLQGLLDDSKAENIAAKKQLSEKLLALREIQFSCSSEEAPVFEATLGDTLQVSYHKCLSARTRIFGWHLASMGDRYQNYNLNYLTDLVLYGYELSSGGKENNPRSLLGLLEGGILEKNQSYGKSVSLSVYSNSLSTISAFLNQPSAQDQFVSRVKELISNYSLKGINIYLSEVSSRDSKKFTQFISKLKAELTALDKNIILTLSIPPIANSRSIANANAYEFLLLNPLVDFYLVQTQKLNITDTRIPFSPGALYPDAANSRGSIEGTFAFYANGKVPVGKLVLTVGYQGISWPMPDFVPGTRATGFGSSLDYRTIQQTLVSTVGQPEGAVLGYDPEQASAYLNYGSLGDLRQVWYEDAKSLAEKYSWALANSTGGVAIWGLGADEGYTELWDALGATLVSVDSVVLSSKSLAPPKTLGLMDYLWTYKQDIQWAGLNDIYIGDPNKKPEADYCYFVTYPDRDSLQNLAKAYDISNFWQNRNAFVAYQDTDYYSINSYKDCICMIGRWNRYAEINMLLSIILFGVLGLCVLVILLGVRKHGDEWTLRGLFTGISIAIGLLALIALFFYLFFNTQVGFIGAGSSEVTIWMLILIFGFGIAAGLLINRLRSAKKFAYRELP